MKTPGLSTALSKRHILYYNVCNGTDLHQHDRAPASSCTFPVLIGKV
jgi:hypothetical protein